MFAARREMIEMDHGRVREIQGALQDGLQQQDVTATQLVATVADRYGVTSRIVQRLLRKLVEHGDVVVAPDLKLVRDHAAHDLHPAE